MTLTVRVVDRCDAAPAELWESGFGSPREGVWWYRALEQSGLEDQFTFLYAIVERDGRPVGLAPMFVADVPMDLVAPPEILPLFRLIGRVIPGILVQRTLFIGSPCADEGTIAIAEGEDRRAVLLALARAQLDQARLRKAPMLVWKDLPDDYAPDMAAICEAAGLFATVSYPGARVMFTSADKADYFARMKPSHRANLRKRLRRSAEQAALRVAIVQRPDDAALAQIVALFMQTYERATTRFERLGPPFFAAIAAAPQSHFILLYEETSGALVAFMLCFQVGDAIINKFIGIDYNRPRAWMLYFRLWDAAVDWSLSQGARMLQSGQTGYRTKLELGHELISLTNYARHRNPLVHLVYALVGRSISWASLDPDLAGYAPAVPAAAQATAPHPAARDLAAP